MRDLHTLKNLWQYIKYTCAIFCVFLFVTVDFFSLHGCHFYIFCLFSINAVFTMTIICALMNIWKHFCISYYFEDIVVKGRVSSFILNHRYYCLVDIIFKWLILNTFTSKCKKKLLIFYYLFFYFIFNRNIQCFVVKTIMVVIIKALFYSVPGRWQHFYIAPPGWILIHFWVDQN